VWAPDVREDEVNLFNRMPSPDLYLQFAGLQEEPAAVYASYPFAVEPARDDKPFFFHFFRWGQTREVLATLGRTWQPFGGSGYLVLFALLALVTLLGTLLIIAPLLLRRRDVAAQSSGRGRVRPLAYFGLLGIAFLLVEIPLIQRWMLVAGYATYAFTGVVLVVLLGSSVGSLLSRRVWPRRRLALAALTLLAVVVAVLSPRVAEAVLAWPSTLQWAALAIMLFPLAVFMGMPFPLGLAWVEQELPGLAPWAWAVNGCASVIASVVAAILTISAGITVVLLLGAAAYGLAAMVLPANAVPSAAQR